MPFYNAGAAHKHVLGFGRAGSPKPSQVQRASSTEGDEPARRLSANMDFLRHHIGGKDKRKSSTEDVTLKSARLDISIESPPLVSYGTPENSTGALMSGQLRLIANEKVKLESFTLELVARVRYFKPVSKDCPDCSTKTKELKKWVIISEAKVFEKGEHSTPISYLFEGHLPATTHSHLGSVDYILKAQAVTASKEKMSTSHIVELKRSLYQPDAPRTAVRVFPPTNVKAEIIYPLVIHPIGEFNVQLELNGIIGRASDLAVRWRLRRVNWVIEEYNKMISPPCAKHVHKVGGEGKGIQHEHERNIGQGEIKEGWKIDWTLQGGGNCAMEIPCSINPATNPVCDVKDATGLEVKHRVMLEMVIFEELATNKSLTQWNSTGSARVLRFSFAVLVTERAGLGISWDEESPPMYEDVPESPPGYKYAPLETCHSRDIPDLAELTLSD
jgi:arrestin-related trafficking adapter 1